jgi:hypothetical protein
MDLFRAVIVGASGTPYHDGLFFLELQLPPLYPAAPPVGELPLVRAPCKPQPPQVRHGVPESITAKVPSSGHWRRRLSFRSSSPFR